MKRVFMLAAAAVTLGAGQASAYEFPLRFLLASGVVRNVVVAGYRFVNGQVVGDCSYDIVTSGSGRDPRSYTTHFFYTCTWDRFGSSVLQVVGAPTAPSPVSSIGGVTTYAKTGVVGTTSFHTTGLNTNGGSHGFVTTASAVYAWVTSSGGYLSTDYTKATDIALSVTNIGDLPLQIYGVVFGPTAGRMRVKSNGCPTTGLLAGATCPITVTYDPTAIPPGDNPYVVYDQISVGLKSNAPTTLPAPGFTETLETSIPGG